MLRILQLLTVGLIFVTASEHGIAATERSPLCRVALDANTQVLIDDAKAQTLNAWLFRSRLRNKFLLGAYRERTVEVAAEHVTAQCRGDCYIHSATANLEVFLKRQGALPAGAYVSRLVAAFGLAWLRDRQKPEAERGFSSLAQLVRGGNHDGLAIHAKTGVLYLEADVLAALGGLEGLEKAERAFVSELELKNNWFTKVFGRGENLRDLLAKDFPEYLESVVRLYQRHLSETAKTRVSFKMLELKSIRYTTIMNLLSTYIAKSEFHADDELKSAGTSNLYEQLKAKGRKVDSFKNEVLGRAVMTLHRGRAIGLSTKGLHFGERHAVLLTGYVTDHSGRLLGFKFLNSWGRGQHAAGFGFISVDQLVAELGYLQIIEGIDFKTINDPA